MARPKCIEALHEAKYELRFGNEAGKAELYPATRKRSRRQRKNVVSRLPNWKPRCVRTSGNGGGMPNFPDFVRLVKSSMWICPA